MDRAIKQKWIEALRSGEYKQGQGYLCHEGLHCCLGVLCEVLGFKKTRCDDRDSHWFFKGSHGEMMMTALSGSVADEIGLSPGDQGTLADFNDGGKDFNFIADYIQENL